MAWRSVKYERVYLMAYDRVGDASSNIAQYLDWYNTAWPHSSLDRVTAKQIYEDPLAKLAGADADPIATR